MVRYFPLALLLSVALVAKSFCLHCVIRTDVVRRRVLLEAVRKNEEGVVLGNKYLLVSDGNTSTSGKATLVEVASTWCGRQAATSVESDGRKQRKLVKFSENIKALKREVENYQRIASNEDAKDLFVEIHDFFNPSERNDMEELQEIQNSKSSTTAGAGKKGSIQSSDFDPTQGGTFFVDDALEGNIDIHTNAPDQRSAAVETKQSRENLEFKGQAALVMELGSQDLKSYIEKNGPLAGETLRQAVVQTARIVKAYHAQKMVWTELKSTNFVIQPKGAMDFTLKAIDLESAVRRGENPIDYSVEAIPPEFAEAYMYGREPEMEMHKSFDIFSLGLLWYEMATGKQFWHSQFFEEHEECDNVMRIAVGMQGTDKLCLDHASPMIPEPLRELIEDCLQVDPDDRPKIDDILAHPYITALH
ncbi:serine/threonine protein kinase [Nitzschia inconspicua]|uniref:Serine/threonine protein kinase n=1 Tax=Nitzschia inconspicua TaxID=303405 RepID=A0A9K3LY31_9STRA|nr:serine/threonine protein kinase [Nitzschia inconspicua]